MASFHLILNLLLVTLIQRKHQDIWWYFVLLLATQQMAPKNSFDASAVLSDEDFVPEIEWAPHEVPEVSL